MRIFKIDVGACPRCGVDLEIRAAVHDQEGIRRYLRHVGLPEHPPPVAPARNEQRDLDLGFDGIPPSPDEVQMTPAYQ